MTPEQRRQIVRDIATELVLDAAHEIEYLTVSETLHGYGETLDSHGGETSPEVGELISALSADERDQLTRDIHDAALRATVTVQIPDPQTPGYPRFHPEATLVVDANNGPEAWSGERWNAYCDACEAPDGGMHNVELLEIHEAADHTHRVEPLGVEHWRCVECPATGGLPVPASALEAWR